MASLGFMLGLVPNTQKVESADDKLRADFKLFLEYESSGEFARYQELDKEVNSSDFAARRKRIMEESFKGSPEAGKEERFRQLGKSKEIKNYFSLLKSQKLADYKQFAGSKELENYHELENFLKSEAFREKKTSLPPKEFRNTAEAVKEKDFLSMQKSSRFKNHFKFEQSPAYRLFLQTENSDLLKEYQNLEKEIATETFSSRKAYLLLPPKKKYEQADEYKTEQEYLTLKNSEKLKWYFEMKKKDPFREIRKWELSFEENFTSGRLDSENWMTRYYWGDKIINSSYALHDDLSLITEGKNVEFYDNKIRLITRKEEAEGLIWRPDTAFTTEKFSYTSALISTGKSFRQKYGIFKAKIKFAPSSVSQAFWMVSETPNPHINVARLEKGKLAADLFWAGNSPASPMKSSTTAGASKYTSDFFIYTLEWSPGKLVWKINDKVFKVQTQGVPEDEMYLSFSANLKEGASDAGLPSSMEIDWVRVYKLAEQK
ncbi:MAG: glycoside hydrolase family 16 protein [Bacteroidota bacterium]